MKITQHIKQDGSIVYRSSIYLGIDQITGKQVTTKITGRTKKEVKQKAQDAVIDFKINLYYINLRGTGQSMVG